jgi:beta-glucosidase
MSFPRSVGQVPIYYNKMNTGRPNGSDIVFWSHYADESNDPLFAFGHGLSYSNFEYSDLKIDKTNPKSINVSVVVKNTGEYTGEEVAQLYIRDRVASTVRPIRELKGFEKFELDPGDSKTVSFILTDDELGFYTNKGAFVVEPGMFDVMVGTSSQSGLTGEFELKSGGG